MDIVEFIRNCLNEDEAAALATTPVPVAGRWKASRDKHAAADAPIALIQGDEDTEPGYEDYSYGSPIIVHAAEWQDEAEANLRHIARHDPAHVLADVAAKRRMLEAAREMFATDYWGLQHFADVIARNLAAPYAGRPGYDPAWRVEDV